MSLMDMDNVPTIGGGYTGGLSTGILGTGSLADLDLQSIAQSMNPAGGLSTTSEPMVGGGFGGGLDIGGDTALGGMDTQPQYILSVQDEGMADESAEETGSDESAPEDGLEETPDSASDMGTSIAFKTMLEMGVEEGSKIPTEPIEKGSFASYNRVIEPNSANCRLALEGDASEIQSVLQTLSDMKTGNQRVTFTTPFDSYDNLMLESFDYRRDGNSGFNVLIVDLKLKEIREVESAKTTSSVSEPETPAGDVSADASADGSCVSSEDCGEYQTYTPSASESTSAEEGGGDGQKSSWLYDIIN
jgi:hypothetical protein